MHPLPCRMQCYSTAMDLYKLCAINKVMWQIGMATAGTFQHKLQMVQNAAARVLTRTRKYEHISPVLSTLHWLPTKHRIHFKILLITYKALNGLAPRYLSELLSHYSPSRPLRSQNSGHFIIPRISKSTVGGDDHFPIQRPNSGTIYLTLFGRQTHLKISL